MKGLRYQLKSVLKDKFCLMSFLLPIIVAVALTFAGSIDLSSLGELHFGVLENNLSVQTVTWLERYGPVTTYSTPEELMDAINEPSTNLIGVETDGDSIKTILSGDELDIFRQTADTLPALYEHNADRRYVYGLYLQCHEHCLREGGRRSVYQRDFTHDPQPVHHAETYHWFPLWVLVLDHYSLYLLPTFPA